jgi:signal transduction histidine kinase
VNPLPLFRRFAWVPIFLLLIAIPGAFYFSPGNSYENTAVVFAILVVYLSCFLLILKKLSERALRQSEEKCRLLFTNTYNGMAFHEIILDQHGKVFDYRFIDANEAFERMTGLNAGAIIGKTVREIVPGIENDSVDWIGKYGRVALLGERICFEEYSNVFKKWYHVTAFQTTPGRFGVIFDDITLRKQTEQQAAFDLDAMTRLQKLGSISINDGNQDTVLSEILETAIIIGHADFGTIHMKDSSGDLQIVAQRGFPQWWFDFWQSASRGKGSFGTALERGERVIVEDVEQSPIFTGTPALEIQLKAGVRSVLSVPLISRSDISVGMISIHYREPYRPDDRSLQIIDLLARQAADIIEHTQNTRALRYSEQRLRALVVASSNIIYSMSPDWDKMKHLRGVVFNEGAETADRDWLQKYIPIQEQSIVIATINKAVAAKSVLELEHRVIKSDGSAGWAFSQAVPLIDDHGNIYEWFGASIDISERKEAELALQRRTEELDTTNKELESFSYSVSHDLRSQLNSIKCLSQVLLEKYSDDFSGDVGDFIRKISASTEKMALIINGMMSLARLKRESMICHHIDLVPIINAVFYELQQTDPGREIEICIGPELTAYADARLMYIAFFNLIENAWKYSCKNPQARIEIGTITMENEEVFFIRDNGAGFNMKHAGKLFEPFQRFHSENQFSGTGVGLAIVSKIIHRHGGKIWAESFIGEGATFYFTISMQSLEDNVDAKETFDISKNKKELHFEQFCKN